MRKKIDKNFKYTTTTALVNFDTWLSISVVIFLVVCTVFTFACRRRSAVAQEELSQNYTFETTLYKGYEDYPNGFYLFNIEGDYSSEAVAYCTDHNLTGPRPWVTYTKGDYCDTVLSYLMTYGYPNVTNSICGKEVSADEARVATQFAVWAYGNNEIDFRHDTPRQQFLYDLGWEFLGQAKAYAASGGPNLKCGMIYDPPVPTYNPSGGAYYSQSLVLTTPAHDVKLTVQKTDAATGGAAQVGSSLAGAEFVVTDRNGTQYKKTTDAAGKFEIAGLPMGKITVRETKAPVGYKPLSGARTYDGTKIVEGVKTIEVGNKADYVEVPKAFDIRLMKYLDTRQDSSSLQTPAGGVSFQIISNTTEKVVGTITTDDKGNATTAGKWFGSGKRVSGINGAIPWDSAGYTIHEDPKTTPKGYMPAPDWKVLPQSEVDGQELYYVVENTSVRSRLKIVKLDKETGQSVLLSGFKFRILDEHKNAITQEFWYPRHTVVTTFTTDETGSVTLPESLLPGTYYLHEEEPCAPYLDAMDDVKFVVDGKSPDALITIADNQAKGIATIQKSCSDGGDVLKDTVFDVVAQEDVVSPDGTCRAAKGEVVETVTTDEKGIATAFNLYLGEGGTTYAFVEKKAPTGHTIDIDPVEFSLKYVDGATANVEASAKQSDNANGLKIIKKSSETGEVLEGANYKLWRCDGTDVFDSEENLNDFVEGKIAGSDSELTEDNFEDKLNDKLDEDVNKESSFSANLITDENGEAYIEHLEQGTYHIKEAEAPTGYELSDELYTIYVGEDGKVEGNEVYTLEVEDDPVPKEAEVKSPVDDPPEEETEDMDPPTEDDYADLPQTGVDALLITGAMSFVTFALFVLHVSWNAYSKRTSGRKQATIY